MLIQIENATKTPNFLGGGRGEGGRYALYCIVVVTPPKIHMKTFPEKKGFRDGLKKKKKNVDGIFH